LAACKAETRKAIPSQVAFPKEGISSELSSQEPNRTARVRLHPRWHSPSSPSLPGRTSLKNPVEPARHARYLLPPVQCLAQTPHGRRRALAGLSVGGFLQHKGLVRTRHLQQRSLLVKDHHSYGGDVDPVQRHPGIPGQTRRPDAFVQFV